MRVHTTGKMAATTALLFALVVPGSATPIRAAVRSSQKSTGVSNARDALLAERGERGMSGRDAAPLVPDDGGRAD